VFSALIPQPKFAGIKGLLPSEMGKNQFLDTKKNLKNINFLLAKSEMWFNIIK